VRQYLEYLDLLSSKVATIPLDNDSEGRVRTIATFMVNTLIDDLNAEASLKTFPYESRDEAVVRFVNIGVAKIREYGKLWDRLAEDLKFFKKGGFTVLIKRQLTDDPSSALHEAAKYL
jgi:hypothetical protein